jgi:hypothetical protein
MRNIFISEQFVFFCFCLIDSLQDFSIEIDDMHSRTNVLFMLIKLLSLTKTDNSELSFENTRILSTFNYVNYRRFHFRVHINAPSVRAC